jgi:hypothetical protein
LKQKIRNYIPCTQGCCKINHCENNEINIFSHIFNLQPDFLSIAEEESLMSGIDEMAWDPSQSGRRKQVIRNQI